MGVPTSDVSIHHVSLGLRGSDRHKKGEYIDGAVELPQDIGSEQKLRCGLEVGKNDAAFSIDYDEHIRIHKFPYLFGGNLVSEVVVEEILVVTTIVPFPGLIGFQHSNNVVGLVIAIPGMVSNILCSNWAQMQPETLLDF